MKAVAFVVLLAAAPASAQDASVRPIRRVEVDAGGGVLGGAGFGSVDATLRANDPARMAFRLFSTDARFNRAPLFHVRTGFALSRRIGVEGGLTFSRPELRSATTADFEGAPSITIAGRVDQYFFDASVVVSIDELHVGRRGVPFVAAGAGYLRQLHEGQVVVEEGRVYHVGGGLRYWLLTRPSGFIHAAGLRGDARGYLMQGGVSLDGDPRPHLAVSGSLFLVF